VTARRPEEATRALSASVRELPGVGPARERALLGLGVRTIGDLLHLIPRSHQDRRTFRRVADLVEGEVATLELEVAGTALRRSGWRRSVLEVTARDGTGTVALVFFNQPWRQDQFRKGARLLVSGTATRREGAWQIVGPDVEEAGAGEAALAVGRLAPVYPLTEGLGQTFLRGAVRHALDRVAGALVDPRPAPPDLPPGPMALPEAWREVHFPGDPASFERARARLAYEECFLLQLAMAVRRARVKLHEETAPLEVPDAEERRLRASFPFAWTAGQEGAAADLRRDLAAPRPMNRLLQGDVGSGKTAVALYAIALAARAGAQAALMAPTEILAAQHLATARAFGARAGLRCELLVGGMGAAARRLVREAAGWGEVDLVIGTHALLVEDVAFARLGLVVIDEQHRFGVLQRAVLREKGLHPHALVMTATPIPRTLALTVYGDLDVTVIPDRPPGRTPVRTTVTSEGRRAEVEERVRERLRRGERAYWVFPLVEDSEALDLPSAVGALEDLRKRVFPGFEVALLHGRQSPAEKAAALEAFRSGAAQVLASTSVVEVGLDVPEATVLVVERAERFGLAQLHQLRGRIGRGAGEAAAWFLAGPGRLGRRRLQALKRTGSGFEIAEADLAIRGPGELAGLRQHGLPDLRIADLAKDFDLLARARRDAFALVERDPGLTGKEAAPFLPALVERYGGEARLLEVG